MSGRETWSQEAGFREGPVLVSLRMPRADLPLAAHAYGSAQCCRRALQ